MTETTGGQRVAGALEACGVTTVFGIPGIHNLDIYEALAASSVRHVTARHEQGAGFMADGYARSTGETGVAIVISGPGLTNILTPMAQALHDSVPMLVISSQIPSSFLGKGAGFLHELKNSTTVAGSCAKESRTISSPCDIGPAIAAGLRLAAEGRPGPVHIEIPMDILAACAPDEIFSTKFTVKPWVPEASSEELDKAAALLRDAEKPLMIAGGGARNAGPRMLALAEKLAAPVIESCAGKGVVDENHPLCLGARSHFDPVRKRMAEADVILAVGTELSPTDLWEQPFPAGGTLIQVDLDPANFDRNGYADLGIRGDAAKVAEALLERLAGVEKQTERAGREVAGLISACRNELDALTGMGVDLPRMLELIESIRQALPDDGTLIADMTGPAYVAISEYPARRPRTFLHPVGFGTLGLALPAGIGARIASPDKPFCVLSGDGGFQFTLPELAVAVQEKIPLPVIIWNDGGFGEIRRNETARNFSRLIAVDNTPPDLKMLAAAYGAGFSRPAGGKEMVEAICKALEAEGPTLIEFRPAGEPR